MKALLVIFALLAAVSANGTRREAAENREAKLQSPSQKIQSCRFEARVKQSECVSSPGGRSECFSDLLSRYEACCREGKVTCPDLKF